MITGEGKALPIHGPNGDQHAPLPLRLLRFPRWFPFRDRLCILVNHMIRFALIPATLALAAALATAPTHAFNGTYTPTQYGPPIRYPDPRDWGPDERERRLPPPRSGYPIVRDPCIAYGDCGPRRPRMPPFPERYDLYEGNEE